MQFARNLLTVALNNIVDLKATAVRFDRRIIVRPSYNGGGRVIRIVAIRSRTGE